MKNMNSIRITLPILAALIIATGCGKSPAQPDAIKPARQTSFDEVTSQLDPGGSVYAYLSTDQWLAGLSTNVAGLRGVLAEIPGMKADDKEKMDTAFNIATSMIRNSGLEDATGVGISGMQVTPELHRTKLIVHHKKGSGDGFMWNLMGKQAHALDGLNLLSTNVAMAGFGDFDVKLLWQVIEKELGSSGIPELSDGIRQWPAMFEAQSKMSWDKLLSSLGGEAGIVLTMNDSKKIQLPIPGMAMEISEPGLMLVIKVNDDTLYERIAAELKKTQMAEFTEGKGVKMAVMAFPLPVPVDLEITVASSGGYLFIASSSALVRDALAVRDGSQPGLRKTAEFAALMKYLPGEGNQFFYIDRRFSETITKAQKQSLQGAGRDQASVQLMEKFLFNHPPAYGLSVSGHTPTGWKAVTIGNQDSSTAVVAAPAVAVVAIGAAMVLPAMSNAKEKAQSINCINNMKQQGLSFRLWAGDNGDKYPFNVSKAKGGTLELCDRNGDGYDGNSFQHFLVMTNELGTPKILVCPSDKTKTAAVQFGNLGPENVTYQVRSGTQVDESNPEEVLIYCPIHRHTALADGSVQRGKGK